MSAEFSDGMKEAARRVLELVRERHWRAGDKVVTGKVAAEWIRAVRTRANCTEECLPSALQELAVKARAACDAKETIELSELMVPLMMIALPSTLTT